MTGIEVTKMRQAKVYGVIKHYSKVNVQRSQEVLKLIGVVVGIIQPSERVQALELVGLMIRLVLGLAFVVCSKYLNIGLMEI